MSAKDGLVDISLTEVDRLLEGGVGEQAASVGCAAHCGDYLSSTTMDSISVQLEVV